MHIDANVVKIGWKAKQLSRCEDFKTAFMAEAIFNL